MSKAAWCYTPEHALERGFKAMPKDGRPPLHSVLTEWAWPMCT